MVIPPGRATVNGGVLGVPTTTGVTVRLLAVDGMGLKEADGDPPADTGVTVTPEAVVMPVTATVTAGVAAAVGWTLLAAAATFSLDLSRLWALADGPRLLLLLFVL